MHGSKPPYNCLYRIAALCHCFPPSMSPYAWLCACSVSSEMSEKCDRLVTPEQYEAAHLAEDEVGVGGIGLQEGDLLQAFQQCLPLRHQGVPHSLRAPDKACDV